MSTHPPLTALEYSLRVVLDGEGGEVDDTRDSGGHTNRGVTEPTLLAAKQAGIVPADVTVSSLTELQARTIYTRLYWDACKCSSLPPALALAVFDFAVNSGPSTAVVHLQRVLGVTADGQVGFRTIAAAQAACERSATETLAQYLVSRASYFDSIVSRRPKDIVWLKGWRNRLFRLAFACCELLRRPA